MVWLFWWMLCWDMINGYVVTESFLISSAKSDTGHCIVCVSWCCATKRPIKPHGNSLLSLCPAGPVLQVLGPNHHKATKRPIQLCRVALNQAAQICFIFLAAFVAFPLGLDLNFLKIWKSGGKKKESCRLWGAVWACWRRELLATALKSQHASGNRYMHLQQPLNVWHCA